MIPVPQFVIYAVGAVILIALIALGIQSGRLSIAESRVVAANALTDKKEAQLQAQLAAVRQLQEQSRVAEQKVQETQTAAAQSRKRADAELARWRAEAPPKACEDVVVWGALKAHELSQGW